jgi:hypothetical protein
VGWGANLGYLRTWAGKVVTNPDPGQESGFHIDTVTNQSLSNAAHSLSRRLRAGSPGDRTALYLSFARTPGERRWALDRAEAEMRRADPTTRRVVAAVQGLVVLVLLALAFVPAADDATGRAAAFGLSCVAMLLMSPIAWTHYFMVLLPAALFVPLHVARRGRPGTAAALAVAPGVLVVGHYLAKRWVGPVGLLGLGTTAWFLAAGALVVALSLRPQPARRGGLRGNDPHARQDAADRHARPVRIGGGRPGVV